jgi:hypothetical protein
VIKTAILLAALAGLAATPRVGVADESVQTPKQILSVFVVNAVSEQEGLLELVFQSDGLVLFGPWDQAQECARRLPEKYLELLLSARSDAEAYYLETIVNFDSKWKNEEVVTFLLEAPPGELDRPAVRVHRSAFPEELRSLARLVDDLQRDVCGSSEWSILNVIDRDFSP